MTRSYGAARGAPAGKRRARVTAGYAASTRGRRTTRAATFVIVAALTVAAVIFLWPRPAAVAQADQTVQVNMGGFSPAVVTARAGEPLRLQIVNPDSQFHTDGGGWHQLAIPALGVDARIDPKSQPVVEIPAAAPGEYPFYCDVCCGGKENPSMQGVLRVEA